MKSWTKTLLYVLTPLTLVLALVAGIVSGRSPNGNLSVLSGVVVLALVVLILGVIRLVEVGKLQQTGLRLGQILGSIALLGLFVLAVGGFFFVACASNVRFGGH